MTTTKTTSIPRGAKTKSSTPPLPRIQRPCMSQSIRTAPRMANDCNNCEPKGPTPSWDAILSARSKKSGFSSSAEEFQLEQFNTYLYEPHRVLGFLFSELKAKLQYTLPDDKNVHKILSEIQQTMKRLATTANKTPFTASSCNLVQEHRVKRHNSYCQTDKRICSLLLHEKGSQTEVGFSGLDRFLMEAQIKQSHEKLKENCDALEKVCAALQEEKYSIHAELCRCHNEIALLKTEVSYFQTELKEATSREKCITQDLEEQCRHLQDELKSLQNFLSKQNAELAIVESLSGKLKESSEKISLLERSRLENDKILVFTQLEKEKLMVLHKFRENQMESLHRDIAKVYKLLKEQLAGIHFGTESSGCGDGNHKTNGRKNQKNSSHRKNKIDLSLAPASGKASNFKNNLQSMESFRNETKSKKMLRNSQTNTSRSFHFADASNVACDLFSKEAITLNDDYQEYGDTNKAVLSSSSPGRPKNHKGEQQQKQERQETGGNHPPEEATSALNMDAKRSHHSDNEAPTLDYFYSRQRRTGDKKSRVDLNHAERWGSATNELTDFDEFKQLLDDVIPPSSPRPFKGFSTSSSPDASFDLSQVNSSNG